MKPTTLQIKHRPTSIGIDYIVKFGTNRVYVSMPSENQYPNITELSKGKQLLLFISPIRLHVRLSTSNFHLVIVFFDSYL